ncbi:MAG: ABC-type multidrug transport system permease subunit [Candidatus Binatia bacterium]|jgi:ABC-type multidrug transport system permease subunit
MIWTLLRKDFLRARRNYSGFLIALAMPLFITGLIGSVFGPSSKGGGVPTIKVAVVDEDGSFLAGFLRSAMNEGGDGGQRRYFEPIVADRAEAMELIGDNEISAVLIVPSGFTEQYFTGGKPPPLELIKNPAQSFLPAIVEELLALAAEALNAVSQNLMSEFPDLVETFEGRDTPDFAKLVKVAERVGVKFEQAEDYLFPPLIAYEKETKAKPGAVEAGGAGGQGKAKAKTKSGSENRASNFNIFAFLLPGLVAMFLLFIADSAVLELYREKEFRTLDRIRTMRRGLFPFVASKGVYAMTLILICAAIMIGLGGMIFEIEWREPGLICVLVAAYALFSVGFVSAIAGLMKTRKRAALFNSMIIMFMAFAGGSLMPTNALPLVFRDHISPCFPNYWFTEAMKTLQFSSDGPSWIYSSVRLAALGIVLLIVAAALFNRTLSKGEK